MAKDPVHEALLDMLAAKQKHIKRTRKKGRARERGDIVDLMTALKRSLQGAQRDAE